MAPLAPAINSAQNQDFDDVLWLLDDYILETTQGNIFVILRNRQGEIEWITPPSGSSECIRPSVTLQTIIDMKEGNIDHNSKPLITGRCRSINDFVNAAQSIIDLKEGTLTSGEHTQNQNGTTTNVSQRSISIHEFLNAYREGRLIEAFLCSDQDFIQPITKIGFTDRILDLSDNKHEYALQISEELRLKRETSSKYVRSIELEWLREKGRIHD